MIITSKISHFLLQLYIIKSYSFHPTSAFNYKFHTLPYPTIFLTAPGRSKEFLSISAGMQEKFQPIPFVSWLISEHPFVPLLKITREKIKSWTHTVFPTHEPPTFPPHHSPAFLTLPHHYPSTFPTLTPHQPLTNILLFWSHAFVLELLTLQLSRHGKHAWLIARQLTMTAGWWDASLALQDLAEAISITSIRVWKNNIRKGRGLKIYLKGGGNQRRGRLFEKGG